MPIENRKLAIGTRLVARYKGEAHVVEVIDTPEGTRYRNVASKAQFKSLSSAGVAIMNGIQCNGWRFFSLQGDEHAASAPHVEKKARPKGGGNSAAVPPVPRPKTWKLLRRTPNQKGVEEGFTRFFCDACMRSFNQEGTEAPTECPEGHKPTDPALATA